MKRFSDAVFRSRPRCDAIIQLQNVGVSGLTGELVVDAGGREGGAEEEVEMGRTFHLAEGIKLGEGRIRLTRRPLPEQVGIESGVVGGEGGATFRVHAADALRTPRHAQQCNAKHKSERKCYVTCYDRTHSHASF